MSEHAAIAVAGRNTLRGRRLIAAAALTALAGCGGGQAPSPSTVATTQSGDSAATQVERLSPVPRAVLRRCRALAASRRIDVLCPERLPDARWAVSHPTLRSGPCAYLIDLNGQPPGRPDARGEVFHVLAGGRCREFPLRTANGRWPADTSLSNDLGLVGAKPLKPGQASGDQQRVPLRLRRRTTIAGHPALLLGVEGYPRGGVHGGHLAAVWNQDGAGYALTLHFAPDGRRTAAEQEAVVVRAAEAMSARKETSPTTRRPNGSVQPRITPRRITPSDAVRVAITARRLTGVVGDTIRHYSAYVDGSGVAACVQDRDVRFPPDEPGQRVEVRIDPARRGPGKRWCPGTFTGRVVYFSGYRCPSRGRCDAPPGFPTKRDVVARFTFRVDPGTTSSTRRPGAKGLRRVKRLAYAEMQALARRTCTAVPRNVLAKSLSAISGDPVTAGGDHDDNGIALLLVEDVGIQGHPPPTRCVRRVLGRPEVAAGSRPTGAAAPRLSGPTPLRAHENPTGCTRIVQRAVGSAKCGPTDAQMSRAIEESNRRMLRARDAMDRDYARPLDIATLAGIAHVSEAHFIRTFRGTFGETPYRYLQRRRVERAMFLLRESDRKVSEICLDVGFRSLGTFSRTFTEIVGEPPTTYRRGAADLRAVPACFAKAWTRPSSSGEATERPED